MSYNGSGVFSLVTGNPVVTGTVISSTWANNTLADIANNGLSNCLTKDGQQTPTNNIPLGNFRLTGVGDPVNAKDAVNVETLQNAALTQLVGVGGTGDAITASTSPAVAALTAGMTFTYTPTAANTLKNPTINIATLGAKTIVTATGAPLIPGYLAVGVPYQLLYDGTNMRVETGYSTRIRLTANQNFFVTTAGNDTTGDGLTSASAWATIQNAWNQIQNNYDLNGFTATINVGTGTFPAFTASGSVVGQKSVSSIVVSGSGSTISTSTVANTVLALAGAQFTINGCIVSNSFSGGSGIVASGFGSAITMGASMAVAFCSGNHILAATGGLVQATATYAIQSGAGGSHYSAGGGGSIGVTSGITVAISGSQGFTNSFASAQGVSQINAAGITFTGTGSGTRYTAGSNSMINTGGAGANYFPGSAAGVTATGGIYI